MSLDLTRYNSTQLRQLKKDIDRELEARRKKDAKQAKAELKAVAEKYGMSLSDLVGAPTPGKGRASATAQYVHPEDPSKTWSGRGRKPLWLKELEARGYSPEQFEA